MKWVGPSLPNLCCIGRRESVPLCRCAFCCTTCYTTCHQIQTVPLDLVTDISTASESCQKTKGIVLGMGRQKWTTCSSIVSGTSQDKGQLCSCSHNCSLWHQAGIKPGFPASNKIQSCFSAPRNCFWKPEKMQVTRSFQQMKVCLCI